MLSREQGTQTDRFRYQSHGFYGLTLKDILKFVSSLLLPLMLGVFTVVFTIHQQNVTSRQRVEDRQLARQQWLEDQNASRLQRQQELDIANNQSDANRRSVEVQKEQEKERYRNDVLVAYIREIGDLLKESNGSLTTNPLTATLARVKTLNVFRQLDPPRNMHIIRFLYEADQLTNTDNHISLDLSKAELYNIDFGALFNNVDLTNANFTGANLHEAKFIGTIITDKQLRSALSIRDARLPNGTLGQNKKLLRNGNADCNSTLTNTWQVYYGAIVILASEEDPSNCRFTLGSAQIESKISQRIDLAQFWDADFWMYSHVILNARMTTGVSIQVSTINGHGLLLEKQTL
ncbi:unnamed protein product, partial [Adineta steineri]